MKVQLSEAQLLSRRRILAGLEPLRSDCSIEAVDGIDVNAVLRLQLRQWYLNLLDTADPAQLALQEVAPQLSMTAAADNGSDITLPDNVRRLVCIRLADWTHAVTVVKAKDAQRRLAMALNHYCRPTYSDPLAVDFGGGLIRVYPTLPDSTIASALAAVDTGEDSYAFDDSALASLAELPLTLN